MGTINLKANLRRIGFMDADKYITSAVRYSNISSEDLIKFASENSGISKAQMSACFYALNQQMEQFILNGHGLILGTLGTFYLGLRSKAVDNSESAGAEAVKSLSLRFRQSKKVHDMLESGISLNLQSTSTTSGGSSSGGSTGSGSGSGTGGSEEETPL